MQGFAPADDLLLFRQKEAKPFLPVRGTTGNWSTTPNQDGSETRSAQTVFTKEGGFGVPAQPRTKAGGRRGQHIFERMRPIGLERIVLSKKLELCFEGFPFCGIQPSDAAEPEPRIDFLARAV